jgi:hypothetical protein
VEEVAPAGVRGGPMARVRYPEKADLAPDHQYVYDDIAASRGGVHGNFQSLRDAGGPLNTGRIG